MDKMIVPKDLTRKTVTPLLVHKKNLAARTVENVLPKDGSVIRKTIVGTEVTK